MGPGPPGLPHHRHPSEGRGENLHPPPEPQVWRWGGLMENFDCTALLSLQLPEEGCAWGF